MINSAVLTTLQGLAVLGCAAPIPHCDAPSQDAFYCTSVESMPIHAKLLQSPQEEEALPGCLDHLVCVSIPGEVVTDVDPAEPEAADHFHCRTVDMQGCVLLHLPPPKVHNHLLSLADVKSEVIILTPCCQGINLPSVC